MTAISPITPNHESIKNKDWDLSLAIDYINTKIINKDWHCQAIPIHGYNAIILAPVGKYLNVMDAVVEKFKEAGWDCKWGRAYDPKGLHYCFYVSKSHFQ